MQLKDKYKMEEYGTNIYRENLDSEDEKRVRRLLAETTSREETEHHLETGSLGNTDYPSFPDSYPMTTRRMESLERK